ncbi:MAG TPA: hypothetical protein VNS08_10060 [Ureibacillus sp.]|nr:hypothetical protein [Ureibacillus sp.]
MMKQCWNCKKIINVKEFVWSVGPEVFCSADCLPEGVLNERYAMDYVGLLSNYNEIEDKRWPITEYEERQDLLSEIDYCITQFEEYNLGDLEGSFYKQELRKLNNDFLELRDRVSSCFLTKENLLRDIGFYVKWEGIIGESSLETASILKQLLQNVLNESDSSLFIMYNWELNPETESRNIVYVIGNEEYTEDEWKHPVIEQLYNVSKSYFDSFTNLEVDPEELFDYQELAKCPKCGCMEPSEDFWYEEKYHMLVCSTC